MHLTSLQLCQLIGREYTWLDTRRRVARARLAAGTLADAQAYLPLSTFAAGAEFDARDVVRMAVATQAESLGMTFDAGAQLAVAADVARVLDHTGPADLYAVAAVGADGNRSCWCGSLDIAHTAPAGAITVNLSAVLRTLRARAAEIGVDLDGTSTSRPMARRLRRNLTDMTMRPPRVMAR